MEKVRPLLEVLESFAESVAQVKKLIIDIENEIREQTASLKIYLGNLEEQSARKAICDADSRSTPLLERELEEKTCQIKKEIELLEKMKQTKMNNNDYGYNSVTDIQDLSFESSDQEEEALQEASVMIPRDSIKYLNARSIISSTDQVEDFLKWQKVGQYEGEDVDWDKEQSERKRMKLCLVVSSGHKSDFRSCREIQTALRRWTAREKIPWSVEKNQYLQPGKTPVLYVRCKTYNDRQKVIDLWERTRECEGILHMSKALTDIEQRERKKMLDMTRMLRDMGHHVVFEDKSICIDGQWWKYFWGEGWRKV